MWEELMSVAISNGLWAVLSCVLLFYLLNDSKKREKKYTDIINSLHRKLDIVEDIKVIVSDVKVDTAKILEAKSSRQTKTKVQKVTNKIVKANQGA